MSVFSLDKPVTYLGIAHKRPDGVVIGSDGRLGHGAETRLDVIQVAGYQRGAFAIPQAQDEGRGPPGRIWFL